MSDVRTNRGRLAVILLLLTTTACANSLTSYRTERFGMDGPRVITQDAKTRNLVMLPPQAGAGSEGARQWRVCAEAAPDVFSALSASASADLGLNTRGSGTDAQARAAMAIAEAAGTIERTQTINMLRESMYRTCERYMSGGIDRATLVIQAGRDSRAMIAILAIEQLTRNARPAPTIIAAGSTSAAIEGTSDAVRQLIVAQGVEEQTQQRLTTATHNKPASCDPLTAQNTAACTEFTEATAAHNRAVERVQMWESVAKAVGQTEGRASTQPPPANPPTPQPAPAPPPAHDQAPAFHAAPGAGGGGDAPAPAPAPEPTPPGGVPAPAPAPAPPPAPAPQAGSPEPNFTTPSTVAGVVDHIVSLAFATDETQLICLQVLQDTLLPQEVRASCLRYVMASVDHSTAELYTRADVQQGAVVRSLQVMDARRGLIDLIKDMPTATYEATRTEIAQRIPGFCGNLTRDTCVLRIRNGWIDDDFSRQQIIAYLAERAARRTQ